MSFSLILAPSHAPSNTCYLGPTLVHNPNALLIGSAVFFAQIMAECHYTLQWAAPFPLKITHSDGGSGHHLVNTFQLVNILLCTLYHSPKLHPGLCSSVSMRRQTDRHTDACDQYTFRIIYDSHEMHLTDQVIVCNSE